MAYLHLSWNGNFCWWLITKAHHGTTYLEVKPQGVRKASRNGLSVTSRMLFKQDQIYFQKIIVQSIMQTTVVCWKNCIAIETSHDWGACSPSNWQLMSYVWKKENFFQVEGLNPWPQTHNQSHTSNSGHNHCTTDLLIVNNNILNIAHHGTAPVQRQAIVSTSK